MKCKIAHVPRTKTKIEQKFQINVPIAIFYAETSIANIAIVKPCFFIFAMTRKNDKSFKFAIFSHVKSYHV